MKKWITKNDLRIGQRREGLSLQFSLSIPQFRIIRLFSRSESKQSEFKTPILDSQRKTHL